MRPADHSRSLRRFAGTSRSSVLLIALLGCGAGERAGGGPPREAGIATDARADASAAADAERGAPEIARALAAKVEASRVEPEACALVEPPPGFVDLREQIPSAVIAAGYHRPDNFTGAPLPGYEAAGAWLEREAAAALTEAGSRLRAEGLRLIIYDAYRPRRASEAMVEWCRAHGRSDLLDDGWVAARSAHGRGRAVDLGLADEHGTPLDMGSAWDQFDRSSHLRGVVGLALERRLRLRAELVRVGFRPYAREWWHFGFAGRRTAPIRDVSYACR